MASGVAKYAYTAPKDGNKGNFLEFKQGDNIEDIKLLDGGWWYGSMIPAQGGKKVSGYFPSTYITLNERIPSGKQASYDGGALRRSNSKTLAQLQSEEGNCYKSQTSNPGSGSMARRSSINQLRMMAYGTTSDVVESNAINSIKKSNQHHSTTSPNKGKTMRRMSSTTPLEFVNERILQGEVHTFAEEDESNPATNSTINNNTKNSNKTDSDSGSVVFKLKDDATNSYFTFKDGVYAWVKEE